MYKVFVMETFIKTKFSKDHTKKHSIFERKFISERCLELYSGFELFFRFRWQFSLQKLCIKKYIFFVFESIRSILNGLLCKIMLQLQSAATCWRHLFSCKLINCSTASGKLRWQRSPVTVLRSLVFQMYFFFQLFWTFSNGCRVCYLRLGNIRTLT